MSSIEIQTPEGGLVRGTLSADGRTVDLGEHCTHCGRSTAPGSSLFVNRIPSGAVTADGEYELDGYMCAECQAMTCEVCGEQCLDWSMGDEQGAAVGKVLCDDCAEQNARLRGLPAQPARGVSADSRMTPMRRLWRQI